MTTGPSFPMKRKADTAGRLGHARAWWQLNGALIMGPWLLAVSVFLIVVALQVREDQEQTKRAAKLSCERSMLLGPYLADDYERREVFPPAVEPSVRATLPKTCPK